MAEKAKKSTQPPPEEARVPARVAGAAVALLLIAGCVWMLRGTFSNLAAERLVARSRLIGQMTSVDTMQRDIPLQRALQANPHEPKALFDRAQFLISKQKDFFQNQRLRLMSAEELEEALTLMEQARAAYPGAPMLLRARGEAAIMLAQLYSSEGRTEDALEAWQEGFSDLLESARLLPRPRSRREDLNAAVAFAARNSDQPAITAEFLHNITRDQEQWVVADKGMEQMATAGWFGLGLVPHQMREIRYVLERRPNDQVFIAALRLSATRFGEDVAVRRILEDLATEGKLGIAGGQLLAELRAMHEAQLSPEEDLTNGEEESADSENE